MDRSPRSHFHGTSDHLSYNMLAAPELAALAGAIASLATQPFAPLGFTVKELTPLDDPAEDEAEAPGPFAPLGFTVKELTPLDDPAEDEAEAPGPPEDEAEEEEVVALAAACPVCNLM